MHNTLIIKSINVLHKSKFNQSCLILELISFHYHYHYIIENCNWWKRITITPCDCNWKSTSNYRNGPLPLQLHFHFIYMDMEGFAFQLDFYGRRSDLMTMCLWELLFVRINSRIFNWNFSGLANFPEEIWPVFDKWIYFIGYYDVSMLLLLFFNIRGVFIWRLISQELGAIWSWDFDFHK